MRQPHAAGAAAHSASPQCLSRCARLQQTQLPFLTTRFSLLQLYSKLKVSKRSNARSLIPLLLNPLPSDSAYDLRLPRRICEATALLPPTPALNRAFDTNFVLSGHQPPISLFSAPLPVLAPHSHSCMDFTDEARSMRTPAAVLSGLAGEATLRVFTDAPGLQVYCGNWLSGCSALPSKAGTPYSNYAGIALEPQAFPNAVNVPSFWPLCGDTVLQVRARPCDLPLVVECDACAAAWECVQSEHSVGGLMQTRLSRLSDGSSMRIGFIFLSDVPRCEAW